MKRLFYIFILVLNVTLINSGCISNNNVKIDTANETTLNGGAYVVITNYI